MSLKRFATRPAHRANRFRQWPAVCFLAGLGLFLAVPGNGQEKPQAKPRGEPSARAGPQATTVFIPFTYERILKLAMGRESIRLNTPYGKLSIPIANIRSIDFATRISDADARRANAAAAKLSSPLFRVRRAA